MNQRQRKKKNKRSCLGITDEFNLIGMTESELDEVFQEREWYRKRYGYRKKYHSKARIKEYYFFPSKRQIEETKKWFNLFQGKPVKTVTVTQSIEQLTKY